MLHYAVNLILSAQPGSFYSSSQNLNSTPEVGYWQQEVSYSIEARLEPDGSKVYGRLEINYRNNSPVVLKELYFHLYPNGYRRNSLRYEEAKKHNRILLDESYPAPFDEGYIYVKKVFRGSCSSSVPLDYFINETVMKVTLDEPVPPGADTSVCIDFVTKVPFSYGRFGRFENEFRLAQWYPKVCVFDKDGWHTEQYHIVGEFFGEFASWDVKINVPANFVVAATGELVGTDFREKAGRRTYTFHLEKAHDFAWAAAPDYRVKRQIFQLSYGTESKRVAVEVYYRTCSEDRAQRILNYAGKALRFYSGRFGLYPYKVFKVVGVNFLVGGMEYPTLVMISSSHFNSAGLFERAFLENTIAHEVSHQWWYGVVAPDEFNHPWIDEGLATFSARYYMEHFYGKFNNLLPLPRWVPNYSLRSIDEITFSDPNLRGYTAKPDSPSSLFVGNGLYFYSAYLRPSFMFDELLTFYGEEKFLSFLKDLYTRYKFRHVYPEDIIDLSKKKLGLSSLKFFNKYVFSDEPLPRDAYCGLAGTNRTGVRFAFLDLPRGREFLFTAFPVAFPYYSGGNWALSTGVLMTVGEFLPFMVFSPYYVWGEGGKFAYVFYTYIPYPLFRRPVRATDFEIYSEGEYENSTFTGSFRFSLHNVFSPYYSNPPVCSFVPGVEMEFNDVHKVYLLMTLGFDSMASAFRDGLFAREYLRFSPDFSAWTSNLDFLLKFRLGWRTYLSLNSILSFYKATERIEGLRFPLSEVELRRGSLSSEGPPNYVQGLSLSLSFPFPYRDFYFGPGPLKFIRLSWDVGVSVFSLNPPSFDSWTSFSEFYKDYFVEPFFGIRGFFAIEPFRLSLGVAFSPYIFSNLTGEKPPDHGIVKFFLGYLF